MKQYLSWRTVGLIALVALFGAVIGAQAGPRWQALVQLGAGSVLFGLWVAPKTWSAVVVTVADLNQHIRDNLNVLKTWIGDDGYPLWTAITKTTTYTVTATDSALVYVNGTFTLSLPASPTTGKPYLVKNISASTTTTVAGNGHNIDGVSTFALGPYDAFTFHYNGTQWSVT